MSAPTAIRARLLLLCHEHYQKALAQDDGYGTRKKVRRGLLAAQQAIETVPVAVDTGAYLRNLQAALEHAKEEMRQDPDDEDRWAAGAVGTILNAVERELG